MAQSFCNAFSTAPACGSNNVQGRSFNMSSERPSERNQLGFNFQQVALIQRSYYPSFDIKFTTRIC